MIERCQNTRCADFKDYGGRGIEVCKRWERFENFLADMGEKPTGLTLGRKDNNGGYSLANCRWETQTQQARNRRSSRIVTAFGVTATLAELCERFHVSYKKVWSRLELGWTPEAAFSSGQDKLPAARL